MQRIELLSPAKNFEIGKAAIDCGADAIYIGASKFGARAAVGNSINDIEKLANYAHKYYAKVYVTLNTLLYDNELTDAQQLILQIWNAGSDALIIQDMGLLEMDLPSIPIFASTQTNNVSWQKVQFLEKVGIQRVILARELSIDQIAEIRKHTTVELESFIHGAICVCYSGQCYLSQELTGRSGNRGECAQPCRWDFNLKNGSGTTLKNNKHLLSLKDLNLTNNLENLIDAGVSSFKIEGRLKDIAYVKNITGWYRKRLDEIIEKKNGSHQKSSSGKTIFNFSPDPERTFNRGYTEYFIKADRQQMASFATQKSIGKLVGQVLAIENSRIKIKSIEEINNGDGLCYIDENETLSGFKVNRAEGNFIYPNEMPNVKKGTTLYRNHDQVFEAQLEKQKTERKIDVQFQLSETTTGIELSAIDEDNIIASVGLPLEKEPASNEEVANNSIVQSLGKTGNTIFTVVDIAISFNRPMFIKSSVLNELRRNCIENLEKEREKQFQRKMFTIEKNIFPFPENKLDYRGNILNNNALFFYERHGAIVHEKGFESMKSTANKTLMATKYCLKFELGECPKYQGIRELSKEKTIFLENGKTSLQLEFDCVNCEMIVKKK